MDRACLSAAALAAAYLLDLLLGDPPALPHPVRLLGRAIGCLERLARRLFLSALGLKIAGALIVIIITGSAVILSLVVLGAAYRAHLIAGLFAEVYIFFAMLAGGDLYHHVARVEKDLQAGNLDQARASTANLVSRDTGGLDESSLSRAALESLFENSADGLVAPLFFAALGGPPGAVFYKAINTLDSMLGYRNEKYGDLGFVAARADDLFSFIPARLTALVMVMAGFTGGGGRAAWRVLKNDRAKHESPNSAWPEAAGAGVIGVRLGGADRYGSIEKRRPLINAAGREAESADIRKGLELFRRVSVIAFLIMFLLSWFLRTGGRFLF